MTATQAPAAGQEGEALAGRGPHPDQPHPFTPTDPAWPDWCACGRIRSIAGTSPVHTDERSDR